MSKTIQIFTVVTIIGLMMFGFFSGVPGLSIPRAAAASGTAFDNVVTILMENHGLTDIVPSATYMTSLANTNGLATHYVGVIHPSEGNYVAMISGDTYGFTGDCGYCPGRTSAPNIVDRLESAGLTWQAFAESASGSGTCSFHPPRGGDHYAFITFTDIQTNSARCANMLNTSESNDNEFIAALNTATPANYIWLTPTDSNNMHDNSVSSGDAYLSTLVPRILSSTTFTTKRAALFIVFDEGNDNCSFGDCVYASWIGPAAKKAFTSTTAYDHYSYLHTILANWNLPTLTGNDASATTMMEFFAPSGPIPLSTSFIVPTNPIINLPVTFTSTTLGGTSPYTVAWNFGDGSTGTGALVTHIYTTTQTFTVTETATDSSSPAQTATSSQSVSVAVPPPLTTSFTVSPANPLVNTQVTFTATSAGGTGPYTVAWTFGDGSTGTGPSVTHTYTAAQAFTVTETATDSSTPAQTATSSKSVTVSTTPPLTTSFTVIPSSPVVNTPATLTASTSGGTGPYTISWSFGDGSTGSGTTTPHTYAAAQSFTVTETARDSSTPQQTTVSTNTVTVSTLQTGNFGSCASLPQGWNCGNTNGLTGSSVDIVSGVLQTRESNPGVGSDNSYYYSTAQKGTFPWDPCRAPANGVLPSTVSSVSTTFTPLTITASGSYRYHIYVALYYWLPNGPVSAGGSTYQCLDTQVRIENIGGSFSPVGSTSTYNPGDSFGWDQITIGSVSTGQTYTLTADVQEQCQQDEAAWGIPTSTPCQLAGIEIGTEGFQFQTLDVDWIAVALSTTSPPPLSASINFTPSAPVAGQGVSFTGSAIGGTAPYTYAWTFGDGGTASGSTVSHAYSTPGSYSVQLIVADNSAASASTTQTVTVAPQPPSPVQASFTVSPTSILVGQAVTFTGTATGGTQPYSYSWDFGDGATGSGAIAAYAYSTSGSFTVTLTVADSASQTGSASKSVPVSPSSIPDFTANASPTTVSVQAGNSASTQVQLSSLTGFAGTVLLTVTSSPTGPSPVLTQPSLSLTSGGSAATTLTISTTTSTTAMNYDVRVVAVGGSTSHTIHVTLRVTAIPPPPDIDISTSQSTLLLNAGATTNSIITLTSLNGFSGTVLVTATGAGLTFSLTTGIVTLSAGSSQTLTLTVGALPATQTGTYTLTVYAASGSLQRSTSLTVEVTVNSPPTVNVPATTSGFPGFSIQFIVNATDPDQGQTVTFSSTGLPPGASFDTATGAFSWTPLPSQAGTYTMTFTATDDGNPPMSNSNSVTVTVEGTGTPPPPTQNQGTCLLCQITQTTKTNTWVLVTGILAGFMLTMTAIYLRARGRLQEVRRMRRLTRYS
ncbi:hypothetical protein AUG19_00620 [archaeon 13_1_20CM_2_54_9]|nr:MAG: hypothetical protein AUG19_00620 [archaeon 13_1_20CM_2_54_9]